MPQLAIRHFNGIVLDRSFSSSMKCFAFSSPETLCLLTNIGSLERGQSNLQSALGVMRVILKYLEYFSPPSLFTIHEENAVDW